MGKKFDLEEYDMVKDRIDAYVEKHPDYRVETDVLYTSDNADVVIVKASVYMNRKDQLEKVPHGTGIAEETRDAGFVNETSHVENAETSAIGRALANVAFKMSDKRPSKEEMEKVQRTKEAKSEEKEAKEKAEPSVDEGDEVLEKMKSFDNESDLVEYFNEQVKKRSGKEKDKFQKTYGKKANDILQDLKKED